MTEVLPAVPAEGVPLPSSSKRVLRILDHGGILTYKDIVQKTRLNPRTVRYALRKLREAKLLILRLDLHDLRQITYQAKDLHVPGP